jgi:hypothetical protein
VGGSRLFVAIFSGSEIVAAAYDAATGNLLWTSPTNFSTVYAASPDGSYVYAVGGAGVFAYDGATGSSLWTAPLQCPGDGSCFGFNLGLVGNKLYVAAAKTNSQGYVTEVDFLVLDSATGQTLATGSRSNIHADDLAGFVVSADGSRAFMELQDLPTDSSGMQHDLMCVVAFDARTGQNLWLADYFGPNGTSRLASFSIPWMWGPIATNSDGSRVFAAAESSDGQFGLAGTGFSTVAYDGATGAQLWVAEYNTTTPVTYIFVGPVVSLDPLGRAVYVAGPAAQAEAFVAFAYDPDTGATLKTALYTNGVGVAHAMALTPDGSRLFVGAESASSLNTSTNSLNYDIVALAYNTGLVPLPTVVSRKTHGSAGDFDINLPLTGSPGIECRSGGPNGNYMLVFTFPNTVTSVGSVSVTSGTGSVASSNIDSADAHNYIVNLTRVGNAQTITVRLNNVTDSSGNYSAAISASMGVLLGDVNASRRVDAADVSLVRQQTLQPIDSSNFREDINASGRIDAADVSIARQQTLTSLP